MKSPNFLPKLITILCSATTAIYAGDSWFVETQSDWADAHGIGSQIELVDGQSKSLQPASSFSSKVKAYNKKRRAESIEFSQSDSWDNWKEVPNVGLEEMRDALIFLPVKPGEYYMLGRYSKYQVKRITDENGKRQRIPPPFPKEEIAAKAGYHAWHSSDMKTWTHCGPVSTKEHGEWMTTAEYADGKFYLYYDYPNDQDPHLWVDDNLRDGKPGKSYGLAVDDPSHGSDSAVFRDEDGTFHVIFENWDYNNPQAHAWDAPVAGHAVSPNGLPPFKILDQFIVDERTTPTGKTGTYTHVSGKGEPLMHRGKLFTYQIHEPEQNAFGDWTAIKVGAQYYLFCDYDPVGGHIKVGRFTSDSLDKKFRFCGSFGDGHPDPSVGFAEGQFYLIQQRGDVDFVSPGPWVPGVEARVGVDTSGDGKINKWTKWQEVTETYSHKPGFARIVDKTPATIDLRNLPAGYGFAFEYRTRAVDGQIVNVVMDQVELKFR
jgi:hypothetical protein